jgi:hypothetical protein
MLVPVADVAVPVTVTLYVPLVALVTPVVPPVPPVPVPPVLELLLLDPPHPLADRAATDSITTRSAPQRRRLGIVINNRHARLAPEPTTYQGLLPACGVADEIFSIPVPVFALICEAVRTKLVVPAVVELMTTGFTEKL